MARFNRLPILRHAPRQPDDAFDRVVQDAGAQTRLLNFIIARRDGADPAQVMRVDGVLLSAQYDACIGGIVADRISDDPRCACRGVFAQDAGVEDFERWRDIVCGCDHVFARHFRAANGVLHDKGDLSLHAGLDETALWDGRAGFEQHVIKQNTAVRDVDIQRRLHRL